MPLLKSSLASALEGVIASRPEPTPAAASDWAQAYLAYASPAMSTASSLATNAAGNQSMLLGAFSSAFASEDTSSAGSTIAQGVTSYWLAILWSGATAVGATTVPGNFGLAAALSNIFGDTQEKSANEKAGQLADAFDAGAKQVVVTDIPIVQPAPPIVGPIQ